MPEIFLWRHAVQAQMSPKNTESGGPLEHHAAVLQVRVENTEMRHDHDQVGTLLVHGFAQRREDGLGRGPAAVVRGGQVQQQLVTGPYESRVLQGELALLAGHKLVEDTTVPVVFVQQHAGRSRPAAAGDTVQDDGAGVGEYGTSLAHTRRSDQYVAQSTELILGDPAESRLVGVLELRADVDVARARDGDARAADPRAGVLVHRSLSS
ncbi:hypothetical protein Spa2297_24935 [Streptomyces parvulus]|uniref:Uncharacterized protein n=1 Tax=Streptomyces parvulus TaxID=146923 RepID=A0A191V4S9_9ACTN|nr:hypothetical protein Spa2297_24935 [Streptomyces parvulus]